MAHRALTLKYRPQVFTDLVGQDHVTSVLTRAIENKRIAHAYLFAGARGVGKTTAARILAKALNCENLGGGAKSKTKSAKSKKAKAVAAADPCNTCPSCTEITSGVSLDVAEIDGASNRGIADVQALRENVRFSPTGGRYRVVIIDEVHQLSNDAFAALLKTLEEPPPHLVFIFATTDPQKLPETIRSRTQRFDFARVPIRRVADRILDIAKREAKDKEGLDFELTEGAALLIAHKSEGSLRDAVSALDQVVTAGEKKVDEELVRRVLGLADSEAFFALGEAITGHDPKAALHALHAAFEKGFDARDLAEGLTAHIRHILILKVDPDGAELVAASTEDLKRLRQQGEQWSETDLLRLLRIASESSWPMRDSPQPMFHLEAAVMQMATLEHGETLAEILQRLEQLERRLSGGGSSRGGGTPARGGRRSASTAATTTASGAKSGAATWSAPGAGGARGGGTPPIQTAPGTPQPAPQTMRSPSAARPSPATPGASPLRASSAAPAGVPAVRAQAAVPRPSQPIADPVRPARVAPHAYPSPAAPDTATAVAERPDVKPVCDATVQSCWRKALEAINGRKRMLGAFLEESQFIGRAGASLVIGTDDLHRSVIEDHSHVELISEEATRAFGEKLEVRCVPATAAAAKPKPKTNGTPQAVRPNGAPSDATPPDATPPDATPKRVHPVGDADIVTPQTPDVAPASDTPDALSEPKRPSDTDLKQMADRAIQWFEGETFTPDAPKPRRPNP